MAQTTRRYTFLFRLAGAVALVELATLFFYGEAPGWTVGGFALAWAAVLAAVRPDVRRSRAARVALAAAAAFGLALANDPGLLAWSMFWTAIASATLLPHRRFDDALRWGARLVVHALLGLARPFRDARRLARVRSRRGGTGIGAVAAVLALPVVGGAVFGREAAAALPVIEGDVAGAVFEGLAWRRLRLRQDQQLIEWAGPERRTE